MRRGYHSNVLGEFFPTAKSLLEKCRNILDSYMDPALGLEAEMNVTDSNFFYELVMKRDPERIEKHGGLFGVYRSHRFGVPGRHLRFVYEDGSEDMIGWSKMASPVSGIEAKVTRCLRDSVRDQIEEAIDLFLSGDCCRHCPMTGVKIGRSGSGCEDKAIVHHEGMSFSNIRDLWLAWHGIELKDIVLRSKGTEGGSRIADANLERAWQQFHREQSKLVVVSEQWHIKHHSTSTRRSHETV
jgi:hypothetical protein